LKVIRYLNWYDCDNFSQRSIRITSRICPKIFFVKITQNNFWLFSGSPFTCVLLIHGALVRLSWKKNGYVTSICGEFGKESSIFQSFFYLAFDCVFIFQLSFIAYIVNYHFFYELSSLHLLWGSIVGVTGGYICLNIGLYGYVSDITTPEDRTMRLSFLNGMFSAGFAAGSALGGLLYQTYENYYVNFGVSVGFSILGIIMALMIKESVKVSK